MRLLLTILAVLWAWEYLLVLLPWRIPPVLQPLLVVGLGAAGVYSPDWVVLPAAIAGGVGIIHVLLRSRMDAPPVTTIRTGRRSEVGSRIPNLP